MCVRGGPEVHLMRVLTYSWSIIEQTADFAT